MAKKLDPKEAVNFEEIVTGSIMAYKGNIFGYL